MTSQLWWENKEELLAAGEGEVEDLIDRIVAEAKAKGSIQQENVLVEKTKNIYVGAGVRGQSENFDLVVNCQGNGEDCKIVLNLKCREGKLGSKDLREKLASVKAIASTVLQRNPDSRILVTCSTGKDLSVGTALSIICLFYDASGMFIFIL